MPPGNQHIQTTFRRVLPADQLTRKLLLRGGGGDVSHLLGLQREPQRCHAPLNAHAGLTASLRSANMNLPTALCCSGGCLPLSCFFSLSLLFDSPSRALSTQQQQRRGGGVRTHTHIYKQAYTKCNKKSSNGGGGVDGRLLSEFLVQLIFVCESGRGYNCSHVDWSQGERGEVASRFSGRLAQVSGGELVNAQKGRVARAHREELGVGGGRREREG